jgi:small subunit ribosomal protein S13
MARIENLIRIANTDMDGSKGIYISLTKIKGVGFMFANALCKVLGISKSSKVGEISEPMIARIEDAVGNPEKFGIPSWLFNRRNDPETGRDLHVSLTNVIVSRDEDIKIMKKIKCYKGVRHLWGLPVRGQRTKSNFRKNKGKATGVKKKKEVSSAAPPVKAAPKKEEAK